MMSRLGQRRDFFVKKWFQSRIIIYYLLILLAGGGTLAFVIYKRAVATLRYCLFRGHSTECSTWEILRKEVVDTNVAAAIVVMALAIAVVLLISWSVARASRAVRTNIRSAVAGGDPDSWPRPPRPHEFRNLQGKLAAGLAGHRAQVEEMRRTCSDLRDKIRAAREALDQNRPGLAPGQLRELHARYENLKILYRNFKVD
ncbi:MAG: hypothetical protein ACYC9Y_11825 [Candidatus Methylomirabilia bacterium]